MALSDLFDSTDDDAFRLIVSDLLADNAHEKRKLSGDQYIKYTREIWKSCCEDDVYKLKMLVDPIAQPQFEDGDDKEPYCVLVARIGPSGELVDAPPGYTPPDYPDVRLSHIVIGSPSGGYEPDASLAQTYLLAYFDVLGFESLLRKVGLEEVHGHYRRLIEQALRPHGDDRQWSLAKSLVREEVAPALMWLPMHAAHFSDSLLLWVHYHPGHVGEFLERCGRVFCEALHLGVALRGAITVGEAVLDSERNIFLGSPLVEAARLESKQDWVGVALGNSFKNESLRIPIPPEMIRMHAPPLKNGGDELFSDLVLDWPRIWTENYFESATERLHELANRGLPESIKARYKAASTFYEISTTSLDWYIPPGFTKVT